MHINKALWLLYLQSHPQQQAVIALANEIYRYELVNVENHRIWRQFIADYVREICLYGYCVYQLHRSEPLILPGRFVELYLTAKRRLAPKLLADSPRSQYPSKGWKLMVVKKPEMEANKYKFPQSAAYMCMPQTTMRVGLEYNLERRDYSNSRPAVYTRIQNNIATAPGGTRPWFMHGQTANEVSERIDLQALVQHRSETIAALDRITDTALRTTQTVTPGGLPVKKKPRHVEHAVTDGRDLVEARPLQHDTSIIHHTIDRLGHEILFSFGVPPQVQGRNINTERMASSNRLNEQAITHFRSSVKSLVLELKDVFASIGPVVFGDQVNKHALDQVGNLLKTDRLITLYALSYGLDKKDFDRDLVSESRQIFDRKQKTDEQKVSAALKRNTADE